jgi:hypothetical protein
MIRRAYTAPPDYLRCKYDITLRTDGSGAQCSRRAVMGDLCKQHAKIQQRMSVLDSKLKGKP